MASLQATHSGDLTGFISDYLWDEFQDARHLADYQRDQAEYEAKKWGVDPMLRPWWKGGEFFPQALKYKMTPNPMGLLGNRFQKEPFGPSSMRDYISRGQSTPFASPINPKPTNNAVGAKVAGQPFPHVAVGSPLKYQQRNPFVTPKTPIVGQNTPGISSTRQKDRAIIVKDQKLGNFMAAVAMSLSASIAGMNKRLSDTEGDSFSIKEGIDSTIKKLEQHSDTLGDKLDSIIGVLREQNNLSVDEAERKKVREEASDMAEQKQQYEGEVIQKVGEDREEFLMRDAIDEAQDNQRIADPWDMENDPNVPKLERGGFVDGSPGGFPAWLHPGEMVIPWNNNAFKDGEEMVTPRTSIVQNFEMGTERPEKPTFDQFPEGFLESAISAEVPETPELDDTIQAVGRAMEFVPKAAGLVTMNMLGKTLRGMEGHAGEVVEPLKKILTPLESFGVGGSITNNLIRSISVGGEQVSRKKEVEDHPKDLRKKRAWWDFLGWAGTGDRPVWEEGDMSHRSGVGGPGPGPINYTGGGVLNSIKSSVSNVTKGAKTWWGKGTNVRFNEDTASWRRLITDDWKQRGKFGKGGKLGGWDFTRGFRPGVSAAEGGMGSGPTPLIRQTAKRTINAIRSIGTVRGGLMGLILNDLMNPQALGDGTIEGNREIIELLRSQGEDVSNYTSINSPSSRGSDSNFVNLQSFNNEASKIEQFNENQLKISQINTTTAVPDDNLPLNLIGNNPDRDLSTYHNDPYNRA